MSQSNSVGLIDLQIMWNRLIAVVEEQAQTLMRTAFSPIVRECGDLSAGVFDLEGRMLAQAVTGTPGHVNSMAESVKHFLHYFPVATMKPGDAFQVAAEVPHSLQNGGQKTRILLTYAVEKDKPRASPAPV